MGVATSVMLPKAPCPPVVAAASGVGDGRSARRALALATAAYVLGMTAHTTFIFYLAPVALRAADAAGRDAWVFSGTAVATMLAVLPAGRLSDVHPRRRMLRVGMGLLALSYVPLLGPPSLSGVLLATGLTGTGLAFLFVSFTSYVADLLTHAEASSAYGVSGALAILASAAGPFLASLVFRAAPDPVDAIHVNAALFGAGALVGLALTFALPSARATAGPGETADAWQGDARAAAPFVLLYVLMGAGYGMMLPYFAVYFLDDVRLAPETWGLLLAASTVAGALGSVAAGRMGRGRPHLTVVGSQLLHALACLAFLAPLSGLVLGVVYVVRNLFATSVAPVANALLMARARPAARGRAQAYASLAWNLGWAGGAAVGGVLLGRLGGALFPFAALLGLAGAGLAALALRRAPSATAPA